MVHSIVPDEDYITRQKNPETKFETLKFKFFTQTAKNFQLY